VAKFRYFGTTITYQNLIQEKNNRRINSGNACYHSVQNILSSRLLSENIKIRICETTILPVVLYGCETWSLTLREEHRLRVSENRMLRRIFGPKRNEVTGDGRKLHNVEFQNFYSSPNIIRMIKSRGMRWAGHVARIGERRNAYRILVGKPEGNRPLGRPRRRSFIFSSCFLSREVTNSAELRNRCAASILFLFLLTVTKFSLPKCSFGLGVSFYTRNGMHLLVLKMYFIYLVTCLESFFYTFCINLSFI
jgi:hypothetical protein